MIIKRWNGSAFVEEFPKTKAQLVFNNGNTESVFDANDKVKPKFLPDAVFDSLNFYTTISDQQGTNENQLSDLAYEALRNVNNLTADNKRSALGYYWVAAKATSLVTTFNFGNLTYDSVQFNTFSSVDAATAFSSSGFFGEQAPSYATTIPSGTANFNTVVGYYNGVNFVYYRQTGNPTGSTWTNIGSGAALGFTFTNGTSYYDNRTAKLYTWTAASGIVGQLSLVSPTGIYIQTKFAGSEYNNQNTAVNETGVTQYSSAFASPLEIGDWVVISKIEGLGTSVSPYIVTFATINNTYELATGSVDGIVRLSTQTTYANLSGSNVVTDGVLKTVIDNAAFAAASHSHGNITNTGTITTNTAASSGQHLVITSSGNLIQQSAIELGSTTTTFLNNAGAWATPAGTYAHPTFTARSVDTSGVDVLDTFTSNTDGHVTGIATRTLPNATTGSAGVMSAADKTKLDGIATGATANTGTVTSVGGTGTVSGLTLTGTVTTTGNLTLGGTLSVAASNFASQTANTLLAAPNGSAGVPTFRALATADIPNSIVTLAKIENSDSAGISVIGRSTNSAGVYDEIAAATDGHVLRRSGTTLGFGLITTANIAAGTIQDSNLNNIAANTIKGRISAGVGNIETLTATNVRTILEIAGPIYVQTATPTATVTHALWYDIN